MSLVSLSSAIELGLIYSLVSMGLYVSFRILNIADLTVDGSFTLGAAVAATSAAMGHPILGIFLAILAGGCAGFVTAFLQTKLKVQPILAGILTMTALYTINLMVMGNRANLAITRSDTVFVMIQQFFSKHAGALVLAGAVIVVVVVLLILFLGTQLGLSIRATGDNEDMVRSSSINPDFTKTVGLCVANAMVSLSGALIAHYQGSADVSMGIGMVIIGLASLIIGEIIFGHRNVPNHVISVVLGSIVYRIILAIALELNFSASSLKLISALIVTLAISYPAIQEKMALHQLKKRGARDAANHESV